MISKVHPHYRNALQEAGISRTISGLWQIWQNCPFLQRRTTCGTIILSACLQCPQSEIVRIHASSGTTGKPTVAAYTQRDVDNW